MKMRRVIGRETVAPKAHTIGRMSLGMIAVLAVIAGCASYPPLRSVDEQLPVGVSVTDNGAYLLLRDDRATDPAETGIVFYPGGLVRPESYVSLFAPLAAEGVPVAILRVAFNLAVFDMRKASVLLESEDRVAERWFLAGHSLGAAMAARFLSREAADYPEVAGLILLAGYPPDNDSLEESSYPALSIWASEDGLSTAEDRESTSRLLPSDTTYAVIQGGNHAGFGEYGPQTNDGEPLISRDEQHEQTRRFIALFLEQR